MNTDHTDLPDHTKSTQAGNRRERKERRAEKGMDTNFNHGWTLINTDGRRTVGKERTSTRIGTNLSEF